MGARPARPRRSHRRSRRRLWSAFFHLGLLLIALLGAYASWTDHRIRTQFEGSRWALPARVYARPLELYPGLELSRDRLRHELERLGYRRVNEARSPGEYQESGERLRFHTRGFIFWDGVEPRRLVELEFAGGRVAQLGQPSGQALALLRLEPVQIGKIYPLHNEDRVLVRLDEVPPLLIQLLLAVEDRNYFAHRGIDPRAILRALVANIRAGAIRQGGSTLTQQLVKNFYLDEDRTLARKLNEALMALLLEWRYDKREILEAYLNEIFLGQDGPRSIHGFGLASEFYFGRPLSELAPHEFALLVALARGASYYNPRRHAERAAERRNMVLAMAVEQGHLGADQALAARRMPLGVIPQPLYGGSRHPAVMDLLRRQLRRDYQERDLRSQGLQIFTTLDPQLQEVAETAVRETVAELEQRRGSRDEPLEGALVVASADTGEVLAVVGSRRVDYPGFNRALDARRPIGSLIKPAVYLAALTPPARYQAWSPLDDGPYEWRDGQGRVWTPQNYDGEFHGVVPLSYALANSLNVATVRLGMDVGLPRVRATLQALGVEAPIPNYPSLLLGTLELSPLEVAQFYQTLASGGFHTPLRVIREVLGHDGGALKRYPLEVRRAVDPGPAFIVKYLLSEAVQNGTGRALVRSLPRALPLAGKTGTTNDLRDSWFAGFGGDLLGAAWVGLDSNEPAGLTGAAGALRVWSRFMEQAQPRPLDMTAPEGVVWQWIDPASGSRTDPDCPGARRVPFLADNLPMVYEGCRAVPRAAGDPPRLRGEWFQ